MAEALLVKSPGDVGLREVRIPEPAPGEVLVETHFSCVSPGTESRVVAGRQSGAPPFPFIPGYAASGRVVAAGPGVGLAPGENVFFSGTERADVALCWGAHVSHAVVSARNLSLIPAGVDLRSASAAKLAAIAYHGLTLSRPAPHEKVTVIGLGPIGFLSALLHRMSGADVLALDLSPARRALAAKLGLATTDSPESLRSLRPEGAEIVVDATGVPAVLGQAAGLVRNLPWDGLVHPVGRLLVQGSYAEPLVLPYDALFEREAHVLVPRDCRPADILAVLDLMRRGLLVVEQLLEDLGSPEAASDVYASLGARPFGDRITGVFCWSGAR